ncbi:MAG: glycoside hydrolase family 172 protein, partial [Jatrophihabitantaceae bacterium]
MSGSGLARLSRPTGLRTRSISAENPTGEPGGGGRATTGTGARPASRLGQGWKVSPSIDIAAGETAVLADTTGPGMVEHIWLTTHRSAWRRMLLRFAWDGADVPAVAVPLGDFFCQGWGEFSQVSSEPVAVNPNGGFNSYWPMPFQRSAHISVENLSDETITLYHQIDLGIGDVPDDSLYLHARWNRTNPVPRGEVHQLLDESGAGHYVGTYFAWGTNSPGWWGEGEVKFYLDGDE